METKLFELLDRATFIPILCVLMESTDERESYLLRRSGYGRGSNLVLMVGSLQSSPSRASYDIYDWGGDRTRQTALDYIEKNWPALKSGDVIDVEFILGESKAPKKSEQVSDPFYA